MTRVSGKPIIPIYTYFSCLNIVLFDLWIYVHLVVPWSNVLNMYGCCIWFLLVNTCLKVWLLRILFVGISSNNSGRRGMLRNYSQLTKSRTQWQYFQKRIFWYSPPQIPLMSSAIGIFPCTGTSLCWTMCAKGSFLNRSTTFQRYQKDNLYGMHEVPFST